MDRDVLGQSSGFAIWSEPWGCHNGSVNTSGSGADELPAFLHPFAVPAALRGSYINIVGGSGAEVVDASGRRYIDALASLWYCQVGHGRAEIVDAVARQMGTLGGFHTLSLIHI